MEVIIFCVTVTMIMAVLLVGIGVQIGRYDKDDTKGELDGDTNSNVHVCGRCRDRECDNGCDKSVDAEEIIRTLQTIRVGASQTEKEALDYACECIYIRYRLLKYINEVKNNVGKD